MSSLISTLLLAGLLVGTVKAGGPSFHLGSSVSPQAFTKWNIDVRSDGVGLPEGQGTVQQGELIYAEQCARCHGEFGEGTGRNPSLFGGEGTLDSDRPERRIGGFWPFAPTLFDYIRRTMPFGNAQTLSNDALYSLVALILNMNDLWDEEQILTRKVLIAIKMPNRDGFLNKDPRPDTANTRCMHDCLGQPPRIRSRATLDK